MEDDAGKDEEDHVDREDEEEEEEEKGGRRRRGGVVRLVEAPGFYLYRVTADQRS